ncbi:uncharacterized protein LOC126901594 [Daktulosphaira vitifoliae]|uniref:uncharacterized protein LOC126901594 n=1 Tax=Daktulosphaira vitifoliae TaxID=58002 RepID=UPI0021AAC147|nr:uncharacterized protein LOC126901594 [Daktulosphaira vitifoliae]
MWRRLRCVVLFVAFFASYLLSEVKGHVELYPEKDSLDNKIQNNSNDYIKNDTFVADILKQVVTKKCSHHYSMTCLKLDLVRLVDRLGTKKVFQLFPGISIVRSTNDNETNDNHQKYQHIPLDIVRSLVKNNDSNELLDGFLVEKIDEYLNSLSFSVKLVDSTLVDNIRKMSSRMLINIMPSNLLQTGRGKKHGMHAALWSAGTLAAIGFAALAALSGKALMTAMLALVLAAISAMRGQGGGMGGGGWGGKTSHYEIITKPAAVYDHDHLVHGATYSSAPYSYARHLIMEEGGRSSDLGNGSGSPSGTPQQINIIRNFESIDSTGSALPLDDGEEPIESYPLTPITYIPTNNT